MVVKDDLNVLSTKRYSLNGKIKKFMYTAHVQRKKEKINTTWLRDVSRVFAPLNQQE